MGRNAVVMHAHFAQQPAALKLLMPELAEDAASAVATLNTEQRVYSALAPLQGMCEDSMLECALIVTETGFASGCMILGVGTAIPRFLGDGLLDDDSGTLYRFLALEQ
jgi:hypothetical protein